MAKIERTLEELLQSLAGELLPEDEERGRVTLGSTNSEGETPLHIYLWRGDNAAAQTLIAHGANINAIGDMGETPLHVAARTANVETLAMLLVFKARTDIVSEFGQTPLQLAESFGRGENFQEAQVRARRMNKVHFGKKRNA